MRYLTTTPSLMTNTNYAIYVQVKKKENETVTFIYKNLKTIFYNLFEKFQENCYFWGEERPKVSGVGTFIFDFLRALTRVKLLLSYLLFF